MALLRIVHYATSAMKRFLTSVSLQHEPKASDPITLVKKTFFRTSIVRNFISRGVKMRIAAREACVKPHLRTRSDIKEFTRAQHRSHTRRVCECLLRVFLRSVLCDGISYLDQRSSFPLSSTPSKILPSQFSRNRH